MIRTLILSAVFAFGASAVAAMPEEHGEHKNHADHQTHEGHDHSAAEANAAQKHERHAGAPALANTPEIATAVKAGGETAVVEVLGVVCDFCATAMNKTFGKREEVAAVYVDLDVKTLNLVFNPGASLSDETIDKLVKKAGYRIATIHRGVDMTQGDTDAVDPS